MLPRLRLVVPLIAWTAAGLPVAARAADPGGAAGTAVWASGFGAAPGLWAGLAVAAIFAGALVVHLGYALSLRRGAPPELGEAITHAMTAGNYQEAWEACSRWPAAFLARVLRPALERIGQGRERVEAALVRRADRERRSITMLTWSLLGVGVAIPLGCLLIAWAGFGGLFRADLPGVDARALTLAEGNFALIAAVAFAVAIATLIFWLGFRSRGRMLLSAAREEAARLVADLAYDDLEGLRVGKEFDAGSMLEGEDDGDARQTSRLLRVSRELTSSCPQCNAPINFSRKTCPHCGTAFEWT